MKKASFIGSIIAIMLMFITAGKAFSQSVNVTGKWNFKVESAAGTGTPVFVLKQQGDSISGTYSGQLGEAPVKGSIKDKNVRIEFKGGEIAVVYTGTVDGNSMKGKVVLGDLGEGTFTGTKEGK